MSMMSEMSSRVEGGLESRASVEFIVRLFVVVIVLVGRYVVKVGRSKV
mgnify:CR=1 FL=1